MGVYIAAKLPDLCLPIEAVFWLAFGRAPETHVDEWKNEAREYQYGDYRINPNVVGDTYPNVNEFPLPEEIAATGTAVDEERYFKGIDPPTSEDLRLKLDAIVRQREEAGEDVGDYWTEQQLEIDAHSYTAEMQALVGPLLDECRAEVFLALRNGQIQGRAFRWADEEMRSHFFEDIPADFWTLNLLEEEPPRFDDPREGYACIYIVFDDVLSTFPKPKGVTNPETGERTVFSTVLDEKTSSEVKSVRPRGAPQKGGGVARAAVRAEISRLLDEGKLSGKKEADIQYAVEWSQKNLDVSVSRSTMQRWIGDILSKRP
ncbi:hypothetical protein [Ruegeria sp. HKCCA5763]|uniref:hypothetical protein n=1 Tax=Ruegeria sp. HKCCA5763 TaxID=2682987 RepID=UPI0014879B8B|nr:hypothetical protein [Ruegeria sp. HKCCA5763]